MSYNLSCSIFVILSFLLLLIHGSAAPIALKSCRRDCGKIEIPYPFGMGEGCYLEPAYEIECKNGSGKHVPFLRGSGIEVVKISLPGEYLYDESGFHGSILIRNSTMSKNEEGLVNAQWLRKKPYIELEWSFRTKNLSSITTLGCKNGTEELGYLCRCMSKTEYGMINASCTCSTGYTGNPYILNGCEDINECERQTCGPLSVGCVNTNGSYDCIFKDIPFSIKDFTFFEILVFLVCPSLFALVAVGLCIFIRRHMQIKRRNNNFKRNGGLVLQQQINSSGGSVDTAKIFTSKELAKATGNFSQSRVLGHGGQGTVYKGMLIDGRIVAVKKSTKVDQDQIQDFINELVVLSHLNHRNIVKILGFCLETQVPILVYEFISNGNLSDRIHNNEGGGDTTLDSWEVRVRIAKEIAEALCYLHATASSFPIFHRDIKTANIMLDDDHRAKLADFGISRSVSEDRTHLTTIVIGTPGYVDPEYHRSNQYTEKSDVYSFGVVLAELITGEKPICVNRSPENRMLATYFNRAMNDNRVLEIIDARIMDESKVEQIVAVARIAKNCLNLMTSERPVMSQVLTELELICSFPEQLQQPHVGTGFFGQMAMANIPVVSPTILIVRMIRLWNRWIHGYEDYNNIV